MTAYGIRQVIVYDGIKRGCQFRTVTIRILPLSKGHLLENIVVIVNVMVLCCSIDL